MFAADKADYELIYIDKRVCPGCVFSVSSKCAQLNSALTINLTSKISSTRIGALHLPEVPLSRTVSPRQLRWCCSVDVKLFHYSWSSCSFLTLCSHQMSVRRFRRKPSLNGSTRSCPGSAVASLTSTWTCGTDACSLNCWRCCLANVW